MFTVLRVMVLAVLATGVATAQWLNSPTPGIPRTPDGKPNLVAPAPRTPEGRPDLSGVWQFVLGVAYSTNIVADLRQDEIAPWADALFRKRLGELGIDDSSLVGCLPRGPRFIVGSGAAPQWVKILQTPTVIMFLSEELAYRQVFMDGRSLPADPRPSFMGYSVGRWEGDTLVVDSVGFNDRTWLDFGGHPHTEQLRMTERFRRSVVGTMELEVTLSDPGAYSRAWTVRPTVTLMPDTDLIEYVCHENDSRRTSIGLSEREKRVAVPVSVLADYVGTYELVGAGPNAQVRTLSVRLVGDELRLDMDGKGNVPLVPLSANTFSTRLLNLEFVRDSSGVVTHIFNFQNRQRFNRRR